MTAPLNDTEKAYFDTILAKSQQEKGLILSRMLLHDKPVAVVMASVHNRFNTEKLEGFMPLAILLDSQDIEALVDPDGKSGATVSPYEVI